MKRIFVEPKGKFAVKLPKEWLYKNEIWKEDAWVPHGFEHYHNPPGAYQISCNPIDKGEIPKIIKANQLNTQPGSQVGLDFNEKIMHSGSFDMYLWMAVVEKEFIMVKYIFDSKRREQKRIKKELERAKETLTTIYVIPDNEKNNWLLRDRYDRFMTSMVASLDLRNRAYENGSFIELIVLLANYIDALLRLGLILNEQLENQNSEYSKEIIFQSPTDKPIVEKKIYKIALDKKIISDRQYEKLFQLYNERNKVVHRYIVTDLKTQEIIDLGQEYANIESEIGEIISQLEYEQYKKGVGYNKGNIPPGDGMTKSVRESIYASVREKHHNKKLSKESTIK